MASKRSFLEIDPDYEDVSEAQNKRRRVLEEGAKKATKKKISAIIEKEFETEVSNKESELLNISERLELARNVMDRLRACIIANYYGKSTQQKSARISSDHPPMIHPAVRKYIGKAPPGTPLLASGVEVKQEPREGIAADTTQSGIDRIGRMPTKSPVPDAETVDVKPRIEQSDTRSGRFKLKKRVIVGNVSKSIPADQRDENDQATHKWMVYVRGPKDQPRIDDYVKKVWFFLHPSYRPNDLVEVSQAPFHLTRRGWGEFPVRVQLHFKDNRNKKVDIIHNLKLDRTYTGLQTLGCETVVDIEIEKNLPKIKHHRPCATEIKQEKDICTSSSDGHIEETNSTITSVRIKTEPADDHDYGVASSSSVSPAKSSKSNSATVSTIHTIPSTASGSLLLSHILSPVTCHAPINSHVTLAQSPVQTLVTPSVISSQPLTFIPMATALQQNSNIQKIVPVTPPKNNIVQLQAVSPVLRHTSPSPSKNVILKGFGSINAANLANSKQCVNNLQNNMIQISPVKCQNPKNTNFIMPQPVILTNVSGNQTPTLTGIQQASPTQSVKIEKSVNQSSSKSNLIFLKCTDNQGKTYLIPQQIGSSISSNNSPSGQIRITSPVSQNVLLTSTPTNNKSTVRLTGPVSPGQVLHNVGTVFKSSVTKSETASPSSSEGEPILFIKPDTSLGKKSTNSSTVKLAVTSGKTFSPTQNVNVVNLKTGKQTAVCAGSPQVVRGQLKVTSQGLMQVQGQLNKQSQNMEQNKLTVNGGLVNATTSSVSQQKQKPVILFPTSTSNKLTVLPNKGKSLLNSSLLNLQQVSQSNGNIITVNPAATGLAPFGKEVVLNPAGDACASKPETRKLLLNGDVNHVAVTSSGSKLQNVPLNHIVIVPVSSQNSVSMAIKGQGQSSIKGQGLTTVKGQSSIVTNSKQFSPNILTSSASLVNSHKEGSDIKACDKTMLIVLQNDKNAKNGACISTQGQRSMSSLLVSRSNLSTMPITTITTSSSVKETPIMITSSDRKEKQIIVLGKENSSELYQKHFQNFHGSVYPEKKIMLDPKKKRLKEKIPTEVKEKEVIAPIRISDYCDMISLLRAVVKRHPIISPNAARHLHPYCAKSADDWLSWNVGKRRASEWQRASSVRKFILSYLDEDLKFHDQSVWSVKQILTWCRLHAYSPHYLEKPLHPTGIDLQAETSLPADKHLRKFTSVTDSNQIVQEASLLNDTTITSDSSDEEVDILSDAPRRPKHKKQLQEVHIPPGTELLPPLEGSVFVERIAKQVGVNLSPTEVEPGYYGNVSQAMIYRAMEQFMGDILRETFALKVNMGRYPDTVGVGDVYGAINNHPITDFLTNKHLGVDNSGLSSNR